ncbi:MAG: helix-turn-helix domain-containing protein [Anaerolineaceae bacterium]|nr:MAG: helix-turn-helix domain-containing protein [Anaerolineaceae bacterium]
MHEDLPFGLWLKKRRKALDLTQSALADRVGCSLATIEKIESEERRPSTQIAELLAGALEIPTNERELFLKVARRLKPTDGLASVSPIVSPPVKTNVPIPPTPLIGRESELDGIRHLLANPECRLVSLIGQGGIGKTRLGIEFALRQRESFPGGVYYVALASINSPELIVPAIADVFSCSFSGPLDPKEQLFGHLARTVRQPALLVLDNLEHLLAESSVAADLVAEILQRFSNIKILCTSRERLNLHGEWMFDLRGLPVPPLEHLDRMEEYSAPALFVNSARRINPKFNLTDEDKPALFRICQLLEGIPLALELAAAWVGMLTCAEIAREIESNMDFLATSMRNIPERHRSLRASFDHSWRLISNAERDTLSRLSIFHGGFDRSAAEKVAGANLPQLSSLVSKSLVRRSDSGRYSLHEVIRQYAYSHLEEDETYCHQTCDRHCDFYLDFASEHESKLKSASQQAAVRAMTAELDNLRAAWDWGIRNKKFESLGKTARAFGWYYEVAGMIHDGIEQLELLVHALNDSPRDAQTNKTLGTCLVQQGLLYFRSGQFACAQKLYNQSIAILRAVDAPALLADALIFSGTLKHLNGDYHEAKALIEEGLAHARALNNDWFIAYGVYNLGHVDSLMGDYQKGYDQMQAGLALWRKVGDPHSISLGLNFLVDTQIALKRYDEAKASMRESIALCEQTKNRWGMGTAQRYLGLAMLADGQYNEARDCFQKSLEVFGEYFEGWDISITLAYLADATLLAGDEAEAKEIYLDSLHHARRINSAPLMLMNLAGLAQLESRIDPDRARGWLTLVVDHPAATRETKDRAYQILLAFEKRPGVEQNGTVREQKSSQSLEELVGTILK